MDRGHATTQSKIDVSWFRLMMILLTAISLTSCATQTGTMTAQVQVPGSASGTVSYDGAATRPSSPSVSGAYTCIDTRQPCLGSPISTGVGLPSIVLVVPLVPGGDNTMVSRLIKFILIRFHNKTNHSIMFPWLDHEKSIMNWLTRQRKLLAYAMI